MDFYVDKSGFKTSLNDRLQSGDKYDVRRYLKNMTCIGINEIGIWSIEQSSLQHAFSSILVVLARKLVDCHFIRQNWCKWKYYSPGEKALGVLLLRPRLFFSDRRIIQRHHEANKVFNLTGNSRLTHELFWAQCLENIYMQATNQSVVIIMLKLQWASSSRRGPLRMMMTSQVKWPQSLKLPMQHPRQNQGGWP